MRFSSSSGEKAAAADAIAIIAIVAKSTLLTLISRRTDVNRQDLPPRKEA
jgi:hypothetical protein